MLFRFMRSFSIRSILTGFISLLSAYIFLVAIGLSLIYFVHQIPFNVIRENVEMSAKIIHKEGEKYSLLGQYLNLPIKNSRYALDGLTDGIMLKETYNTGKDDALENALLNKLVHEDGTSVFYARYWHGYLVTLLPSLVMMDIYRIRVMNSVLFSLLLIFICYLTYKKLDINTAGFFLLTILVSMFFPIVPYSLQFSTVFYISFVAIIILLILDKRWNNRKNAMLLFFIVGGITSYADLLTAPIITVGLPLIFYCLLRKSQVSLYKDILFLAFMWLLGYGSVWGTKWLLAYYITGYDIVKNAVDQSKFRLGNDIGIFQILVTIVLSTPTIIQWLMLVIMGFWFGATKDQEAIKKNVWLLLTALFPILWMCVLKNHTSIHFWFVWRSEIVSVFALLLFVSRTTKMRFLDRCIFFSK